MTLLTIDLNDPDDCETARALLDGKREPDAVAETDPNLTAVKDAGLQNIDTVFHSNVQGRALRQTMKTFVLSARDYGLELQVQPLSGRTRISDESGHVVCHVHFSGRVLLRLPALEANGRHHVDVITNTALNENGWGIDGYLTGSDAALELLSLLKKLA